MGHHADEDSACCVSDRATDAELLEGRRQAALHHAMDLVKAKGCYSPAEEVVKVATTFQQFLAGEPKAPPPLTLADFANFLGKAAQMAESGPWPKATITLVSQGFLISVGSAFSLRRAYLSFEEYGRRPPALLDMVHNLRQTLG